MSAVLMFLIGAVVGGGLTFWALALWADSQSGRRRLAVTQAEQRIRDAQAAAFTHMAEVAEDAVRHATGQPVPSYWPSDTVDVDTVVAVQDEMGDTESC